MTDNRKKEQPLHTGHRSRMRDKLAKFGGRFFESYELLEMLLYSAIPYKDTKPIAKRLLLEFGSVRGVLEAERDKLVGVDGIGERCAEFLRLAGRVNKTGELVYFNKSSDVYNDYVRTGKHFVRYFRENKSSNVALMLLDGNMRHIKTEHISEDTFGSGAVRPAGFIKAALSCRAEVAIIAYTHRHGPLYQSEADRETGKMIIDELSSLGITVAEQYVICGEEYISAGTGVTLKFKASPELSEFIKSKERACRADGDEAPFPVYSSSVEYMVEYLTDVLSFQLKKEGAKEAAVALSVKYGNIDALLSADFSELERVEGMNRSSALLLKLLGYCASRSITDDFALGEEHTEEEIYEYIKAHFIGLERETVYLLSLDGRGRVKSCFYVGEGTVNGSDVYPRRLLEVALRSGAESVIIAHNHPASSSTPSREDEVSTDGLASFFDSAGLKLLAHLIVSGREHSVIEPTGRK